MAGGAVGADSNLTTARRKALAGTSGWVRCDRYKTDALS